MSEKDTNPKDAIGVRKAGISTVPLSVVRELGLAMLEGAAKYGRYNFRIAGVRASVYFDACVGRHLSAWWDEGEDIDPDSGLHHVTKAIACLVVLRDSMIQGNWVDDRPPSSKKLLDANEMAGKIIERHADKSPKQYTIADTDKGEQQYAELTPDMLRQWKQTHPFVLTDSHPSLGQAALSDPGDNIFDKDWSELSMEVNKAMRKYMDLKTNSPKNAEAVRHALRDAQDAIAALGYQEKSRGKN